MSRELKAGFWTVVGAVIAALTAVLSASWIGYEFGVSTGAHQKASQIQVCEQRAVIKVHALNGPNYEVASRVADVLDAIDGCRVLPLVQIPPRAAVRRADVRYFYPCDSTMVAKIVQRVEAETGMAVRYRYMPGVESRVHPGYVELYFP
jgi:hypothetical protein